MKQTLDFDERINPFILDFNELKKNKIVCEYVRRYYNWNKPIKTKKKYEWVWYVFEMECMMLRMNNEIYVILNNIVNKKKV